MAFNKSSLASPQDASFLPDAVFLRVLPSRIDCSNAPLPASSPPLSTLIEAGGGVWGGGGGGGGGVGGGGGGGSSGAGGGGTGKGGGDGALGISAGGIWEFIDSIWESLDGDCLSFCEGGGGGARLIFGRVGVSKSWLTGRVFGRPPDISVFNLVNWLDGGGGGGVTGEKQRSVKSLSVQIK